MRNEVGLRAGVDRFEEIRREKIPLMKGNDQRSWIKALDCANLAWVGEMVTRSALERRNPEGSITVTISLSWIKVCRNGSNFAKTETASTADPNRLRSPR